VFDDLKSANNIEDATEIFMKDYERPGNPQFANRIKYAQQAYSICIENADSSIIPKYSPDKDPIARSITQDILTRCLNLGIEPQMSPPDVISILTGRAISNSCSTEDYEKALIFSGEEKYDEYVQEISDRLNIDANLVRAVIATESSWVANKKGSNRDMGLMQVKPITFADVNLRGRDICGSFSLYSAGVDYSKYTIASKVPKSVLNKLISDPKMNIYYGSCYLKILDQKNKMPDVNYLLAAYNLGPSSLLDSCCPLIKGNFEECYPNLKPQTQKYVPKALGYYDWYKERSGVETNA